MNRDRASAPKAKLDIDNSEMDNLKWICMVLYKGFVHVFVRVILDFALAAHSHIRACERVPGPQTSSLYGNPYEHQTNCQNLK